MVGNTAGVERKFSDPHNKLKSTEHIIAPSLPVLPKASPVGYFNTHTVDESTSVWTPSKMKYINEKGSKEALLRSMFLIIYQSMR